MSKRNGAWLRRLRARLVAERGGVCQDCGADHSTEIVHGQAREAPLEFAHIKPTGLSGEGRGKQQRVLDVRRNPESYRLLCGTCHNVLDLGLEVAA